jgi:HK97 family phage prohead protease
VTAGTKKTHHPTPGLEYKATSVADESGVIAADDETGVVEAIVSVTGVQDHDNDIIEPGAYAATLTKRRPKGIFSHDWGKWASRTEVIEEIMPGDARLVEFAAKMNKEWPANAGGLYVRTRYNMNTDVGRNAYHDVKFFSETGECEWSVGYKVPGGKAARGKDGVRRIKEMDLFEYSPVLFGANSMGGTLSVKSAVAVDDLVEEVTSEEHDLVPDQPWLEQVSEVLEDLSLLDALAEEWSEDAGQEPPNVEPGLGDEPKPDDWQETPPDVEPGQGDEPAPEDPAADAPAAEVDVEGAGEDEKGFPFKKKPPKSGAGAEATTAGGDGETWKITNVEELRDAIRGFSSVSAGDKEKVRAHIMKRAFALKRADLIPKEWQKRGKSAEDETGEKAVGTGLDRSPKKNWVEMTGRLPAYIEKIAKSIHEKRGLPLDQAIPIAIATVKKWAAGGDKVDPDTRTKAAKAVAEWEALKARNAARRGAKKDAEDVLAEPEMPEEAGAESFYLPGTYEELRDRLRAAAVDAFGDDPGHMVEIMGTWPGTAVITRYQLEGDRETESYEVPYGFDGETVELGEMTPVSLVVDSGDGESSGAELSPFPAALEDLAGAMKSRLAALGTLENKAGRVLSATNCTRLKSAVEQLVAVLKAAGVPIGQQEEEKPEDPETGTTDSTAPSARTDSAVPAGKMVLDPTLLARAYRIIGDAHAGW